MSQSPFDQNHSSLYDSTELKKRLSFLLPSINHLRTIQQCSGLIFSILTTLHSYNRIVAYTENEGYFHWSGGPFRFSTMTESMLVLGPLIAHVGSSIALNIKRKLNHIKRKQDSYSKFQTFSGFALVAILPLYMNSENIPKNAIHSSDDIASLITSFLPPISMFCFGIYHTLYGIRTVLKFRQDTHALLIAVSALSLLGVAHLANLL